MHEERINKHVPYEYTRSTQKTTKEESEGEQKKAEQVRGQRKFW